MPQRFNFLDLFGYLIPGAVLLALLWLPYGLTTGMWPTLEVSSGVLALGLAYVGGHVLQGLAHFALPSTDHQGRYPSDWLLDDLDSAKLVATVSAHQGAFPEAMAPVIAQALGQAPFDVVVVVRQIHEQNPTSLPEAVRQIYLENVRALPPAVRQILSMFAAKRFGISMRGNGMRDQAVRRRRQIAFRLCRSALVQKGTAGYVEQYQGMYFLTRGLAGAFVVSAAYLAGWALGLFLTSYDWVFFVSLILVAGAAALLPWALTRFGLWVLPAFIDNWGLWTAGAVLLVCGALYNKYYPNDPVTWGMAFGALLATIFAYRCRQSSVVFQREFAQAVYVDFITLETQTPRNLFAELVAQRAFEKWLGRGNAAGTAIAD